MSRYREIPEATSGMPRGIPYIIGNEAAERFSFYGMRSILVAFMTTHLLDSSGALATMSEGEAKAVFHIFMGTSYLTPVLGAVLADRFIGKYRTILALSIVYCLGHLALALDETRMGLFIGLGLIALGAGGIKPCVSAHVGDQFGPMNQHQLSRVYGWFYMSINLGALISMLLTPVLLERYGPQVAFGVPGLLMLLATLVFYSGRHRFVHRPPAGPAFYREIFSDEGRRVLLRVALVSWLFIAMFWALFDQISSAWVIQGERMEGDFFGLFSLSSSQMQFLNPLLILLLIPFFSRVIFPRFGGGAGPSLIARLRIGFFIAPIAFAVSAYYETLLGRDIALSLFWLVIPYVLITSAEVLVSPTALELFYRDAPESMKSAVMSVYFIGVSLGNYFAGGVNLLLTDDAGEPLLQGANYYLFFAGLMALVALAFLPYSRRLERA